MRPTGWVTAVALAHVATGVAALIVTDFAFSIAAPGLAAREYVLGLMTLVWLIASGVVSALLGRLFAIGFRLRIPPRAALVAVFAVIASFVTVSDARFRSGALDIDALGIALWVPVFLVAVSVAELNAESAPPELVRPWGFASLLWALATLAASITALVGDVPYGSSASFALGCVAVLAVALCMRSTIVLLRRPAQNGGSERLPS